MLLYQSYKLHKISKIYKRAMKRKNRKMSWQDGSGAAVSPE